MLRPLRRCCFLATLLLIGCATRPNAESAFQKELSAAIEKMLQRHQEIAATRTARSRPEETRSSWYIPVAGVGPSQLVDSFGAPRGSRRHEGIDIFAPRGTPVIAVTAGLITRRATTPRGGSCLWLASDDGHEFFYGHLDAFAKIAQSEHVRAGQVLGYVGNSGNASGGRCHLHFEVHENGAPVNPYPMLKNARARFGQPAGAIAAR